MKKVLLSLSFMAAIAVANAHPVIAADKVTPSKIQQKNVVIDGMGVKKSITMNGGTLEVNGANCDITVKGFANEIIVNGSNVNVRIDKVNRVEMNGVNAKVYYKTTDNKSGKVASEVNGLNAKVIKVK